MSSSGQNNLPVQSSDRVRRYIPSDTPLQNEKEELRNFVDCNEFKTPVVQDGKCVQFEFPEFVRTQVDPDTDRVYYVFNLGDLRRYLQMVNSSSDGQISAENREFEKLLKDSLMGESLFSWFSNLWELPL
jgi:hypothetical protein